MSAARRIGRWASGVLGALLLAAAVAYLVAHPESLRRLGDVGAGALAAVYAIGLVGTLVVARMVQRVLASLGTRARYQDMVLLQNAAAALGFVPLKGGAVLRAVYLNRRYGVDYARLAVMLLFLALVMMGASSLLAAGALAAARPGAPGTLPVIAVLLLLALAAAAAIALPVPRFLARRPLVARLAEVRRLPIAAPSDWAEPVGWVVVHFLLVALRLLVLYRELGVGLGLPEALVLAALGNAATLLAATPAGLGVREVALGGGAVALGVPLEIGLLVALIERAVNVTWGLVVGVPAAWVLVHRLRADGAAP